MSVLRSLCFVVGLAVIASPVLAAPGNAGPAPASAPGVKTIIVVRHAEAEPGAHKPGGDPPLTADGRTRALELARTLGDAQLRSVYSTHYQRNRQTAAQLARGAGDRPTVIDDIPAILSALRAEPWGSTALVVGHSNTVPELIRGLTGQALPEAEPIVFDRMWIVTLARDGTASLLRMRYGAPVAVTPAAPTAPAAPTPPAAPAAPAK